MSWAQPCAAPLLGSAGGADVDSSPALGSDINLSFPQDDERYVPWEGEDPDDPGIDPNAPELNPHAVSWEHNEVEVLCYLPDEERARRRDVRASRMLEKKVRDKARRKEDHKREKEVNKMRKTKAPIDGEVSPGAKEREIEELLNAAWETEDPDDPALDPDEPGECDPDITHMEWHKKEVPVQIDDEELARRREELLRREHEVELRTKQRKKETKAREKLFKKNKQKAEKDRKRCYEEFNKRRAAKVAVAEADQATVETVGAAGEARKLLEEFEEAMAGGDYGKVKHHLKDGQRVELVDLEDDQAELNGQEVVIEKFQPVPKVQKNPCSSFLK